MKETIYTKPLFTADEYPSRTSDSIKVTEEDGKITKVEQIGYISKNIPFDNTEEHKQNLIDFISDRKKINLGTLNLADFGITEDEITQTELESDISEIVDYVSQDYQIGYMCDTLIVPEGVERMQAPLGIFHPKEIKLPSTLKMIDRRAFWCCFETTSLELPISLNTICMSAFDTSGISDLYYPGSMELWNEIAITSTSFDRDSITVHCSDGTIIIESDYEGEGGEE